MDEHSDFKPLAGQDFEWGLDKDHDNFLDENEVIGDSETGIDGSAQIGFFDVADSDVFCARETNVSEHFTKLVPEGCDDFAEGAEVVFKNQNKPAETPVPATPSPSPTPTPEVVAFPPTGGPPDNGNFVDPVSAITIAGASLLTAAGAFAISRGKDKPKLVPSSVDWDETNALLDRIFSKDNVLSK